MAAQQIFFKNTGNRIALSPELALGWAELKFLTDGQAQYHKDLIITEMKTYGVVRKLNEFTSFEVIQGNGAAITVRRGTAIDQYGNIMIQNTNENNLFTLTDGDPPQAVILSYDETYIERYSVNIEADGTVTMNAVVYTNDQDIGEGGFKSRVRGIAQFPSLISFPESTLNTGEYLVQTVISDGHLVLNVGDGVLQPEVGAAWAVVGTFTPGVIIDEEDKFPFRRGFGKIELDDASNYQGLTQESTEATIEQSVNYPGKIFLAVVTYAEGVLTIVDKRGLNTYTKSTYI